MTGSSVIHAAGPLLVDRNPTHPPPAREGGSEGGSNERMRLHSRSPLWGCVINMSKE